jgi:hypothetical protein
MAEKIVRSERLDVALVDLKIDYRSEFGGVDFINFVKRHQPSIRVVVLSGHDRRSVQGSLGTEIDAWVSKTDPSDTYINLVFRVLDSFAAQPPKKRCFVIMPISGSDSCREDQWAEVFQAMIKPAVTAAGYECERSQGLAGNIIKLILDDLNRADLVIADLTDRNPNVFYELGVRHALRDTTMLIAQSLEHVPFDLRPYSVITYDWTTNNGRYEFARKLLECLSEMANRPASALSPVREYLNPAPVPSGSSAKTGSGC